MEKFKGTKGKWSIKDNKQHSTLHDIWSNTPSGLTSGTLIATTQYAPLSKANAKLISKAPELLEAMQEFCDRVEKGEVRSTKTYNKFKELIKEATI